VTGADALRAGRDDRAAVDKAVSLLLAFRADAATGVGVSELARRASLSKSTAFRVLAMLERNGVVEKLGQQYRLGARLHELGRAVYAPQHDRVRDLLLPFVADIYEATHETVHLAALHGTDVLYLAKFYGHRPVKAPSRTGGRVPAYATAVGKALLAYDPDAVELALAQRLVPFTSRTVTERDLLLGQLDAVRATGIAREDEESTPGLSCLAAPVFGPSGRPVAALSVSMPTRKLDQRTFEPLVRRVAAAATQLMRRQGQAPLRRTA